MYKQFSQLNLMICWVVYEMYFIVLQWAAMEHMARIMLNMEEL